MSSQRFTIRDVEPSDASEWLKMRRALWPGDDDAHAAEISLFFQGTSPEPQHVLFAELHDTTVGFAELSIRDDIPGFVGQSVAYVEGLYVVPSLRATGISRSLLRASQDWARRKLCVALRRRSCGTADC